MIWSNIWSINCTFCSSLFVWRRTIFILYIYIYNIYIYTFILYKGIFEQMTWSWLKVRRGYNSMSKKSWPKLYKVYSFNWINTSWIYGTTSRLDFFFYQLLKAFELQIIWCNIERFNRKKLSSHILLEQLYFFYRYFLNFEYFIS